MSIKATGPKKDAKTTDPRPIHELRLYLWQLAGKIGNGERLISRSLADSALKMWGRLLTATLPVGDLAIPDAAPGPDGQVLFIWKKDGHYLSLEMHEPGPYSLFSRDESTGEIWDCDIDPQQSDLDEKVVVKLRPFLTT